jgi:hypothetical protein
VSKSTINTIAAVPFIASTKLDGSIWQGVRGVRRLYDFRQIACGTLQLFQNLIAYADGTDRYDAAAAPHNFQTRMQLIITSEQESACCKKEGGVPALVRSFLVLKPDVNHRNFFCLSAYRKKEAYTFVA